jgi:hypothetical protein
MWKVVVVASVLLLPAQALARPRHHLHRIVYISGGAASLAGNNKVLNGRPAGCPHAFCGCEASLYRSGCIIPQLNLAANGADFPVRLLPREWRRFGRAMS